MLTGRRGDTADGGVAMGQIGQVGHGHPHNAPRGCPAEIIDSIPESTFNKEQWEAGDWAKEDASCSVCIEAFEDGDRLRTLPACQHCFHRVGAGVIHPMSSFGHHPPRVRPSFHQFYEIP